MIIIRTLLFTMALTSLGNAISLENVDKGHLQCTPGVSGECENTDMEQVTLKNMDGSIYEGYVNDGKYHGFGKLTMPNGDIYEGDDFFEFTIRMSFCCN